jgi:hypothetical protein
LGSDCGDLLKQDLVNLWNFRLTGSSRLFGVCESMDGDRPRLRFYHQLCIHVCDKNNNNNNKHNCA